MSRDRCYQHFWGKILRRSLNVVRFNNQKCFSNFQNASTFSLQPKIFLLNFDSTDPGGGGPTLRWQFLTGEINA